jgi:histone H3/H4
MKLGVWKRMALIVKSAVRTRLKGMRASSEFFKALDRHLAEELTRAIARAKANGRKTLRPEDL